MTQVVSRARSPLPAAPVLALLALLVQALIPPGYMLSSAATARPTVVICTGHGPFQADGQHQLPPQKQKASGVCAFAGQGPAPVVQASQLPMALAWPLAARELKADHPALFVGRGLAAPPPARGPPSALV